MKIYRKFTITILFCLIFCSIRSVNAGEKIVIDTDAGVDDAIAILLMLKNEFKGYEIVAITCTYGNTDIDNVVQNVLKTLTVANRSDIPVYRGAKKAFIKPYTPSDYFGSDGFGDFEFTDKIIAKVNESKHAAVALVDLVKQYPGEIILLNLGPLTNTALAVTLDPSVLKNLKKHIIMGSSVSGIGNVDPNVEFNFSQDPESNNIALNNTKRSILFPWETVLTTVISMDWRLNVLGKINSTLMNFINKAEKKSLLKATTWTVSDAMTASLIIWPDFIRKSIVTNVNPVFTGKARGTILVDYTNITSRPKNTEIVQSFNGDAFQQVLLEAFS